MINTLNTVKERPILFSGPMVRALLDGSKTQTRRVAKVQPTYDRTFIGDGMVIATKAKTTSIHSPLIALHCPYGQPGERLWVRETWRHTLGSLDEARALTEDIASGTAIDWRATYIERCIKELGFSREEAEQADSFETWRPSIHMPRWASRIVLEIVSVRVELLNDCSDSDALAEGVDRTNTSICGYAKERYRRLWEQINGTGSWEANPFVWVVEFKRVEP